MGLRRENRLLRRPDFIRAYEQGSQVRVRFLHLFILKRNDPGPSRFGFTVTRRFGKSVQRNRMRRQLRECAREILPMLDSGIDIVVNVRGDAMNRRMDELHGALTDGLKRADALRPNSQ